MGRPSASDDDGRLQRVFRPPGEGAVRQHPVSGVRLRGAPAMATVRACAHRIRKQRRRQPESNHESVFSAAGDSDFIGTGWAGGFRHRLRRSARPDVVLRGRAERCRDIAATLHSPGHRHRSIGRLVAFGPQRQVSRRAIHDSLPDADLDVRDAGCVSEQPRPWQMAHLVRFESNGWRSRRFPMGASRYIRKPGASARSVGSCGRSPADWRSDVLPPHGENVRGSCMSDIAIRVEGVGKQYRIGKREPYKTLRDTVAETAAAPFRWMRSLIVPPADDAESQRDLIWALRNVSFEVPRGAIVGIIGRNGAGKSTLLKILSRITEPTEGRVEIHGRVGSLLEVGTGFHPELTGRENIFLNGAILGMRRAEITRKFDEIVAFAEIDRFIDTPVKRYSSGMTVRLAFAVAAHLEPEILIVDEVLAVGDAEFQRKCLGKMRDVSGAGRTVLFVSHNMAAIRQLCERGILLNNGGIEKMGSSEEVIRQYFQHGYELSEKPPIQPYRRY